jgi:hypothetical protein
MDNDARHKLNFNLKYARALAYRERALFTRIANLLMASELATGSAVVAGVIGQYPNLAITAALVAGLLPVINAVWDPRSKAAQALANGKTATAILKKMDSAEPAVLQSELLDLQAEPSHTDFMDRIAYNDTCEQEGLEHGCYKLSRVERLIRALT